jgi:RHS repeat-associated protein
VATEETAYYGLNPHTDVETLTNQTGNATSTYRYTGYGSNDASGFTGKDKQTATAGPEVEAYNPYRFNSKRWDPATSSYDMGFRDYSPGLNRFLTRDMYNGALADLRLGGDPWSTNRYAFAGGNPITGIEYDGHYAVDERGQIPEDPDKWYKIWNARHDTAVDLDKDAIQNQPTYTGEKVTTSRKDNFVRGGSSINPGDENGYPDIIQWGPMRADGRPRDVYVWEVKHGGGRAAETAKAQVDNYVLYLQKQLGAGYIVQAGYVLPGVRSGPNRAKPTETITVATNLNERGVELYDYGDSDPFSIRARRLPNAKEPEQREERKFELDPSVVSGGIVVAGLAGISMLNPVNLLTAGSFW